VVVRTIDVIKVQIKIKKNVKNVKKTWKNKKNVCKCLIKNFTKFASVYANLCDVSALQQVRYFAVWAM